MLDELTAAPSVQTVPPPPSVFTDISSAVDAFVASSLGPQDRGGLVGIATRKGDGSININVAVVQKIGQQPDRRMGGEARQLGLARRGRSDVEVEVVS